MTDSTLNRFVASGTTTVRTGFTPTPPTPASGPSSGYTFWDTSLQALYAWDAGSASWKAVAGGGSGTVTTTGSPASGNLTKFSGATSITNGDLSGDVTTSGALVTTIANNAVTTAKINNSAVTLAKIANASANSRLLGSGSSGSGAAYSELSTGVGPRVSSTTVGSNLRITPQGRPTLVSGTPVMTSNQTAKGTIYYTPYVGDLLPLYDGTDWLVWAFTELTLLLNATDNVSGSIYDIFVFNNSGTLTLGTGPAWSSTTARGTGAGTTEIQQLNGLWTNKNSITLRANGSSLGSVAANQALYLCSAYMTANGQTGMAFTGSASGGANNFLGLWSAYQRVTVRAYNVDSNGGWTYASATWRPTDNSTSNRITYLDGLGEMSSLSSRNGYCSVSGGQGAVSLGFNSTTAPAVATASSNNNNSNVTVTEPGALGLNYWQSLESQPSGTGTWFEAVMTFSGEM